MRNITREMTEKKVAVKYADRVANAKELVRAAKEVADFLESTFDTLVLNEDEQKLNGLDILFSDVSTAMKWFTTLKEKDVQLKTEINKMNEVQDLFDDMVAEVNAE